MSKTLYNIALCIYVLSIRMAAAFHNKARLWVQGRKHWKNKLQSGLTAVGKPDKPLFWIHCASLGEFEQGRPLIEALREKYPNHRILLSFFSPSGYELRRNYPLVDIVAYLPADTHNNAKAWLDILKPDAVFFIKYEFWYHHLKAVRHRKIPLYLVSAVFRPKQAFFQPWGSFFLAMLPLFDYIFVQDEKSEALLRKSGIEKVLKTGDTRIDRVLTIKKEAKEIPAVERFINGCPTLVCGSTWPIDESFLAAFLKTLHAKGWKVIIAPHEVHAEHLHTVCQRLQMEENKIIRYSNLTQNTDGTAFVLLIDNIGMLSTLYRYADLAYIGGGFGKGIHNTLEAVAYEIPVLFGPKHKKFVEAQDLLKLEVAYELSEEKEVAKIVDSIDFEKVKINANRYLEAAKGATQAIIDCLERLV